MSFVQLHAVSKSYFGKPVLQQLNLVVNRGDKLAIIGENGTGKTTLFRLIAGLEQPDPESGPLTVASGVVCGYLAQQLEIADEPDTDALYDPELQALELQLRALEHEMAAAPADKQPELLAAYTRATARFDSLDGYARQHMMKDALFGLGLTEEQVRRPLATLSGGEQMRCALARLLIRQPDLLLLDEPTNHLDDRAIEWLTEYLQSFSGCLLFISHDRTFIDQVATSVAELAAGKLTVKPGNYTRFKELMRQEASALQREIKQLSKALTHEQNVTGTLLSHRKINQYHSRQKKTLKLSGQLASLREQARRTEKRVHIHFLKGQDAGDPHRLLIQGSDLSVRFTDQALFAPFSFEVKNQQKICLCGPNGCGKSTLLAAILGKIPQMTGTIRIDPQVVIGEMGQLVQFGDESRTVLAELQTHHPELTAGAARNRLAGFGFTDTDVFKSLAVLSGGERARLYLCSLILEKPDVLFLDEPTNHLDIHSREILEQAIRDFPGTVISVSHDRYYIARCADEIWGFTGGEIQLFDSWQHYREAARAASTKLASQLDAKTGNSVERSEEMPTAASPPDKVVRPGRERAAERRDIARRKREQQRLEELIAELEAEKLELEASFIGATDPAIYEHYHRLTRQLEQHYDAYIELASADE